MGMGNFANSLICKCANAQNCKLVKLPWGNGFGDMRRAYGTRSLLYLIHRIKIRRYKIWRANGSTTESRLVAMITKRGVALIS